MPCSRQIQSRRFRHALFGLLAVLALLLASCGSDSDGASTDEPTTTAAATGGPTTTAAAADDLSGDITVSAAASLTGSFGALGEAFEAAHPDTSVTFTFDSSDTLADQIIEGAPVDVFASASQKTTDKVVDEDLVAGDPTTFARNLLIIVTKPGNPEGIGSLGDLADVGVVALCGEDVPCGAAATRALETAGVTIPESSVTRGQNVKATLSAVTDGDAVAGLVYVTDALAAGGTVEAIDIPEDQNAVAAYPISVLEDAGNAEVARAFVAYVLSDEGQQVLEEAGVLPPA